LKLLEYPDVHTVTPLGQYHSMTACKGWIKPVVIVKLWLEKLGKSIQIESFIVFPTVLNQTETCKLFHLGVEVKKNEALL